MIYDMTEQKINKAKYKVKANKAYMKSHGIVLNDKIIPFADFVANSYINSDRYIAELQHRAWSINDYARDRGLKNVFITITLPTEWHKLKTYKDTLISNPKFGGRKYITTINNFKILNAHITYTVPYIKPYIDYSKTIDKYTPRNASKELTKYLKKIFDDSKYKAISSDDRCFFRVIEPHKNGSPHLHMSLFVPVDSVEDIKKLVKRKFPGIQSKVETEVNKPVSYLLKYVLKTLDDLRRPNADLTALSLWYVYHGISRFYTSRTFASLDIYRSLKGLYTLNELTQSYNNNQISVWLDDETKKIMRIDNEYATIYSHKVIKETFKNSNWRKDMENEDNTYFEYEFEPVKVKEKAPLGVVYEIEGLEYSKHKDGLLVRTIRDTKHGKHTMSRHGLEFKPIVMPHLLSDFELLEYYRNIDIETVDLKRFGNIRNMCIARGLIDGIAVSLQEYDKDIFVLDSYQKAYKFYSAIDLGLIEKINFCEVV